MLVCLRLCPLLRLLTREFRWQTWQSLVFTPNYSLTVYPLIELCKKENNFQFHQQKSVWREHFDIHLVSVTKLEHTEKNWEHTEKNVNYKP